MPCRIELDWEMPLHVGCTEAERGAEQPVSFSLRITNPEGFPACDSDALDDTIDVECLKTLAASSAMATRVRTLERLGSLLESALRAGFPASGLHWELALHKRRAGWTYVRTWRT